MRVPDGDLPEPTVIAGPPGRELPMRPRCFRCGAVRVDYTSRNAGTGEEHHHEEVVATYAMDPDCKHAWSDRTDPRPDALLEELAGYGLLPDCRQPKVTRWTQDIVRCGVCEGCKLLALAREVIGRHLRHDAT